MARYTAIKGTLLLTVVCLLALEISASKWRFSRARRAHVISHNHHHILEPWSDDTHIELRVPPPNLRNPHACEKYENIVYGGSCRVQCMVQAYFKDIEIRDLDGPRSLPTCRDKGGRCESVLTSKDGFNMTVAGSCNECQCIVNENGRVNAFKEMIKVAIEETKISYVARHWWSGRDEREPSPVLSGVDALRLRIPAPHLRNATACEAYERGVVGRSELERWREVYTPIGDDCRRRCVISGRIGQIDIVGPPRYLSDDAAITDGTPCTFLVRRTHAVIADSMQQRLRGTCRQGVCVSEQQEEEPADESAESSDGENTVDTQDRQAPGAASAASSSPSPSAAASAEVKRSHGKRTATVTE